MKYLLFLPLLLFTVFSCQHNLEKPKDLLSKSEMTDILTDIYLYKQTPDNIPLTKEVAFDTYVSIFKKYHTTKEIFQDSFGYYYIDGNSMQHIYDDVIEKLEGKLTPKQLQQLKEEEKTNTPKN